MTRSCNFVSQDSTAQGEWTDGFSGFYDGVDALPKKKKKKGEEVWSEHGLRYFLPLVLFFFLRMQVLPGT